MKKKKKYAGIIVPAITPLTETFQLDERAVEKLFASFYRNEAAPFILGTTGEYASLTCAFRKAYVLAAEKNKKKGTILYAGISSNSIDESVQFATFCADHAVDVLVATLP